MPKKIRYVEITDLRPLMVMSDHVVNNLMDANEIHFINPDICIACHSKEHGCCTYAPELEGRMFGLTIGEIENICKYSGLKPADFTVNDIAEKKFLDTVTSISPIFVQTMPNGHRTRLKIENQKCVFLEDSGCFLPNEIRPVFCQIYPFWFDHNDRLMLMISEHCLAQHSMTSAKSVMNLLEMNYQDIRELFLKLKRFAGDHN